MNNFFATSIGRKFLMSVSGMFLMLFILIHLGVNMTLIFDDSGRLFNIASHFMGTNQVIRIIEPVLAIGFVVHIIWSFIIALQNLRARPVGYKVRNVSVSSAWSSRNMLVLGSLVFLFLVLHIMDFFWKMRYTGDPLLTNIVVDGVQMENTYALVSSLFKTSVIYDILYVAGALVLGFHLAHGFWSSFQTLGLTNNRWIKRLQVVSNIYAIIVAAGFSIIPLYFLFKF